MPRRRPRPRRPESPQRPLYGGHQQVEEWPDGDWVVRKLTGSTSTKPYRCPGCDQLIPPATPHVVAWPVDPASFVGTGLDERRHWHNGCWRARDRRRRR
ncbi:hypothetical protein [Actinopolymorpha rutila]|uniref:ATP/GTP-binding protein n=1 Tax=Actinopolymorpha rutila TaxID=446787 RepID=A0A852ZBF1_9ACTN|nr:hypothetical protein [Actinopolymorpha rutila]